MEVSSVVAAIGVVLVILLVLGVWKGKVKDLFDSLAALSFVYSSLELSRYIIDYIRYVRIEFPSLFHVELVVVGFAPVYVLFSAVRKFLKESKIVNR